MGATGAQGPAGLPGSNSTSSTSGGFLKFSGFIPAASAQSPKTRWLSDTNNAIVNSGGQLAVEAGDLPAAYPISRPTTVTSFRVNLASSVPAGSVIVRLVQNATAITPVILSTITYSGPGGQQQGVLVPTTIAPGDTLDVEVVTSDTNPILLSAVVGLS